MSQRTLTVTIDQASMADEEGWANVVRFCELLEGALQDEYQNAQVTVKPETSTFNGGIVRLGGDWDGYAHEDTVYEVVKHRRDQIFTDGEWLAS